MFNKQHFALHSEICQDVLDSDKDYRIEGGDLGSMLKILEV